MTDRQIAAWSTVIVSIVMSATTTSASDVFLTFSEQADLLTRSKVAGAVVYRLQNQPFDQSVAARLAEQTGFSAIRQYSLSTGLIVSEDSESRRLCYDTSTSTYFLDDSRLAQPERTPVSEDEARTIAARMAKTITQDANLVFVRMDVESLTVAGLASKPFLSKRVFSFAPLVDQRVVLASGMGIDIALGPRGQPLQVEYRLPSLEPVRTLNAVVSRRALGKRLVEYLGKPRFEVHEQVFRVQSAHVLRARQCYETGTGTASQMLVPSIAVYCETTGAEGSTLAFTTSISEDASEADLLGADAADIIHVER